MPQEAKPLPLAEVVNNSLKVNDNTVFYLFNREELRGRPLAVVSIAGETRCGKSFLMTFFLRYLRNKGWDNRDWLGGDETVIAEGFQWQKGTSGCTKGISVWPEIFKMPLSDGRECAVLIVDTQGLYDDDTSPDTNSKLMSLSTLFSSHQILNLMRQIQQRDLEQLELCVEIARLSANSESYIKDDAFQSLMFLIRDWELDDNLGDGTDCYLRPYFEKLSQSKDVGETKRSIRSAFETVQCFLLCHPGRKVVKSDGVNLQNKHVEEDFIQNAKILVEKMLDPKNITIKKTGDRKEATADNLSNLIGSVGKGFVDGKAPKVENMVKSIIRADNKKLMTDAVFMYREKMINLTLDNIVKDEDLNKHHREALQKAQEKFSSEATLGNEISRKAFCDHLCKECDDKFDFVQRQNDLKKKMLQQELELLRSHMADDYKKEIHQMQAMEDAEFDQKNEQLQKEAIEKFDQKASRFGNVLWLISDIKKNFQSELSSVSEEIKEVRRRDRELKKKEMMLAEKAACEALEQKLLEKFYNEAEERGKEYREDLAAFLQLTKEQTLKEYQDDTEINSERETVAAIRNSLEEHMNKKIEKAEERNSEKKELLRNSYIILGGRFAEAYEAYLEKSMSQAYLDPSLLKRYTKTFFEEHACPNFGYQKLPPWGKVLVTREINRSVEKLERQNERNKKYRNITVDNWEAFCNTVKEVGNFLLNKLKTVVPTVKSSSKDAAFVPLFFSEDAESKLSLSKDKVVQDAGAVVQNVQVVKSEKDFYLQHMSNEQVYQIPSDRKKGKALIINNKCIGIQNERKGSQVDVENLKTLWTDLGFTVESKNNLIAEDMLQVCKKFASDAVGVSVIVVTIMSHGNRKEGKEYFCGENGEEVFLDDVISIFSSTQCKHLGGIPKIFMLQACRGLDVDGDPNNCNRTDTSRDESDAVPTKDPKRADMLFSFSTQAGYASFRNIEHGSWFINAVTNIFMNHAHNKHILELLTMVTNAVGNKESQDGSVQLCNHDLNLKKLLYLFPGYPIV